MRNLTHTGCNWRCLLDWAGGVVMLAVLGALALTLLLVAIYAVLWVAAHLVAGVRHAIS